MSLSEELKKLTELHESGTLSDEEFKKAKGRLALAYLAGRDITNLEPADGSVADAIGPDAQEVANTPSTPKEDLEVANTPSAPDESG